MFIGTGIFFTSSAVNDNQSRSGTLMADAFLSFMKSVMSDFSFFSVDILDPLLSFLYSYTG